MVSPKHQGTTTQFEPNDLRVDTRTFFQKIDQSLKTTSGSQSFSLITSVLAFICFIFPFFFIIFLPICLILIRLYMIPNKRYHNMPYRVPKHAHLPDGSFDAVARKVSLLKNPEKTYGEGTNYYGIDRDKHQQIWKSDSDERTHDLLVATTGGGKTETIKMILTNSLLQNSGFILSDAKGTTELVAELFYLTARFLRHDDILITNFITAGRDLLEKQEDKLSNSFNLMSYTSASMLTEQLVYLLDDTGGDGGMWKGRTIMYLGALTNFLVFLRDRGLLVLEPKKYVEYQELNLIIRAAYGEDYEKYYGIFGEKYNTAISPLRAYLGSLSGFNEKSLYKQDAKTNEQHGYVIMSFTRAISELSFDYGHIYGNKSSEIDMFDVVLNRRCLLIVLPALQNSPDKIRMLGKLCVGSLKQMMAGVLGNRIDGMVRNVIDSKVTASKTCFKVVLDEIGYQIVAGLSVIPAQARGLSFSMTFSGQDVSDILRVDEKEGEAIIATTSTKTIGRINSGEQGQTYTRIKGIASTRNQSVVQGYTVHQGEVGSSFRQSQNVTIEKRDLVSYVDLATQQDGQFTIFLAKKFDGGKSGEVVAVRAQTMFVQPPKLKKIRLNDFVSVEKELTYFDSVTYSEQIIKLSEFIQTGTLLENNPDYSKKHAIGAAYSELDIISEQFNQSFNSCKSGFFAAMRTVQILFESSNINSFSSPYYDLVDSSFNLEIEDEIESIFDDINVENDQLEFIIAESEKINSLDPALELDNITDSYLNLDKDQILTVTEIKDFIASVGNIDSDRLYSDEFSKNVQQHLKSANIHIDNTSIPSFNELNELDIKALEVQKDAMQYVDEEKHQNTAQDAKNRYAFVQDFMSCRDIAINESNNKLEMENIEISEQLAKYYDVIYSQISKNFKDK